MSGWLAPLLTFSYWFTPYPAPFIGLTWWVVVSAAGGAFVVGAALRFLAPVVKEPSTRRIVKRLGNLGVTMGVLTAISFFFTQTQTPTLGSRFWFALWGITTLVWLISILRYTLSTAPKERQARAKQLEYQKYLPR